jgi:hypothetical protein
VAVRSEVYPELGVVASAERLRGEKGWALYRRISGCELIRNGGGDLSIHGRTTDGGAGSEAHLRITRVGAKLTSEWSADGTNWKDGYVWKLAGLEDGVLIGPVAYQTTDKTLTVKVEEWVLKPVDKGQPE